MNCKYKMLDNGDSEVIIKSYHKFLNVLLDEINDKLMSIEGIEIGKETLGNAVKKALS